MLTRLLCAPKKIVGCTTHESAPNPRTRLGIDLCGRRERRLTVSSQVRHDAKQSLDHRELRPVMHLVLFRAKQQFKTALRSATRHAHLLDQLRFWQRLE